HSEVWVLRSVRSGGTKQISTQGGVADAGVTNHVEQRRLARLEGALQRRDDLLRRLDVLAVTAHLDENLVVSDFVQHVERIGAALESGHLIEIRSPRTVVPQHRENRQLVTSSGLHVEATNSESAVTGDVEDLLSRPRQLRANCHSDSMTYGGERTRVN